MTCNASNGFTPVTVWKPHHINDFLDHVWSCVCGKKPWVRDGLRKLFVFKRSKVSNSPWKPREDQDVGKVWELYLSGVSEKVKLTEDQIYLVESVRVIHWGLTGNEMLHSNHSLYLYSILPSSCIKYKLESNSEHLITYLEYGSPDKQVRTFFFKSDLNCFLSRVYDLKTGGTFFFQL